MFQISGRDLRLFANAPWCEYVGIGDLVVAVLEVACLQPALFNQTLDTVVSLAQADAHFPGQFTLAQVGIVLDKSQEFMGDFVVLLATFLDVLIRSFSRSLRVPRDCHMALESIALTLLSRVVSHNEELIRIISC